MISFGVMPASSKRRIAAPAAAHSPIFSALSAGEEDE